MLTAIVGILEQAHLVLTDAGRFVLTIAATLFLAYVFFMATVVLFSTVGGWARSLAKLERVSLGREREPMAVSMEYFLR